MSVPGVVQLPDRDGPGRFSVWTSQSVSWVVYSILCTRPSPRRFGSHGILASWLCLRQYRPGRLQAQHRTAQQPLRLVSPLLSQGTWPGVLSGPESGSLAAKFPGAGTNHLAWMSPKRETPRLSMSLRSPKASRTGHWAYSTGKKDRWARRCQRRERGVCLPKA